MALQIPEHVVNVHNKLLHFMPNFTPEWNKASSAYGNSSSYKHHVWGRIHCPNNKAIILTTRNTIDDGKTLGQTERGRLTQRTGEHYRIALEVDEEYQLDVQFKQILDSDNIIDDDLLQDDEGRRIYGDVTPPFIRERGIRENRYVPIFLGQQYYGMLASKLRYGRHYALNLLSIFPEDTSGAYVKGRNSWEMIAESLSMAADIIARTEAAHTSTPNYAVNGPFDADIVEEVYQAMPEPYQTYLDRQYVFNPMTGQKRRLETECDDLMLQLTDTNERAQELARQYRLKSLEVESFSDDGHEIDLRDISHPNVRSMYVSHVSGNTVLTINTTELRMFPSSNPENLPVPDEGILIGPYKITVPIDISGTIQFHAEKMFEGYNGSERLSCHPHVFSSASACFGNFGDSITNAQARGDYDVLVDTLIAFLQQANSGDSAGKHWPRWMEQGFGAVGSNPVIEVTDEQTEEASAETQDIQEEFIAEARA